MTYSLHFGILSLGFKSLGILSPGSQHVLALMKNVRCIFAISLWNQLIQSYHNQLKNYIWVYAGKPDWRGKLSTVDLLMLTSLDQLLFIIQRLLICFTKQGTLLRRSTVLSLPLQWEFPGLCLASVEGHWHLPVCPPFITSFLRNVCLKTICQRYKTLLGPVL